MQKNPLQATIATSMDDIRLAAQFLLERDDFLILCHQKPDGDTVGSAFALREALRSLGKRAQIACSDPFTPRYDFITGGEREPRRDFTPKTYVTVDVADTTLLGEKLDHLKANIDLAIDHHPSFTRYATVNVCCPWTASVGAILTAVLKEMGVSLNSYLATCLYTSLATDTGCFKYANTNREAHAIAAELVRHIPNLHEVNYRLFMLKSRARMQLEARVVSEAHFHRQGKIAVAVVSQAMMKELGAGEDDLDDIGTLMRCIEGVEVGVLMKETPNGRMKVSFRSAQHVNVSMIAQTFGGGGHRRASGCLMYGPAEEAERRIVEAVEQFYARLEAGETL
ncbi:MAG: bifunctional oligoribonuclease/PAP phosphatase NrnA [Clostridia bacterium]|nr:bifunctional oligoribonuclease/PAP phosphatase NrnA [Clostridia bacterium]